MRLKWIFSKLILKQTQNLVHKWSLFIYYLTYKQLNFVLNEMRKK